MSKIWTINDLNLDLVKQCFCRPFLNRSMLDTPMKVNGVACSEGIGMQAPSYFFLNTKGDATRITGKMGIDDCSLGGAAVLRIIGYNKDNTVSEVIYESKLVSSHEDAIAFDVDVTNWETLGFDFFDDNCSSSALVALFDVKMEYNEVAPVTVASNLVVKSDNINWMIATIPGNTLTQMGFGKMEQRITDDLSILGYPHRVFASFIIDESLRIIQSNGAHTVELLFKSLEVSEETNGVVTYQFNLYDKSYPITAKLIINSYVHQDVIGSSIQITNNGSESVTLMNRDSVFISLPAEQQTWITSFNGSWGDELVRVNEQPVPYGVLKLQHRGLVRSSWPTWPGTMVSFGAPSQEESGEMFAATIPWSGAWQCKLTSTCKTRLVDRTLYFSAGVQEEPVELVANGTYTSPEVLVTYSQKGKGQISRNFHSYCHKYLIYNDKVERPVILNSWEGFYLNFNEAKLAEMMEGAAKLGVEMFVLDDGWFANDEFERMTSVTGLGDWQVNVNKLPNGIDCLIDKCNALGMEFGIWVEPEMVNFKSKLYQEHPEWIMRIDQRENIRSRYQFVLDITMPEVEDFVYDSVAKILIDYPRVRYIKWDCNVAAYNLGSPHLGHNQGALSDLYTEAYYRIMAKLRQNFPNVAFQACSSGGGRTDFGSVRYCEEFWASDETNAILRIPIQWGYSHFYPANVMASHIGRYAVGDFKLRSDVAMTGRLGVELYPSAVDEAARETIAKGIAVYKTLRPHLHTAELYRGRSPMDSDISELSFVAKDKKRVITFGFKRSAEAIVDNIKPAGLNPALTYTVCELNPDDEARFEAGEFTGEELMTNGIKVTFPDRPASVVMDIVAK